MRDVYLKMTVTDEGDIEFIVTPGNDLQFGQLSVALQGLAATVDANKRGLATLAQTVASVAEFGGAAKVASHTLTAIKPLMKRNRVAKEQIEFVRLLLGKSVRVRPDDQTDAVKGPIQ